MEITKTPFYDPCWNFAFAFASILSQTTGNPLIVLAMSFIDLMYKKNYSNPWNALTSFCLMFYLSQAAPVSCLPFYLLIRMSDTETLQSSLAAPVRFVLNSITGVYVTLTNPPSGGNANYILENVVKHVSDFYTTLPEHLEIPTFSTLTGTYLNSLHLSSPVHVVPNTQLDRPVEIMRKYRDAELMWKRCVMILLVLMAITSAGPTGLASAVSILGLWCLHTPTKRYTNMQRHPCQIRDGVWRLTTDYFGIPAFSGIGVSQAGILHAPYHVCRAQPIQIGKAVYQPFFVDVDIDLVTYGGMPNTVTPREGDELYISLQNDSSVLTYYLGKNVYVEDHSMTFPSLTSPGQSGSPVIISRKKGDSTVLLLAGLAGRYVGSEKSGKTEFLTNPYQQPRSLHQAIITYPGSGKTRTQLPQLIRQALFDYPMKKVLVTGPTVVVCREIAKALDKNNIPYGMNVKGHFPNRVAPVQIAAHRSMIGLITSGAIENYYTLILDEAHCDQAATRMLRRFGAYMVSQNKSFIELSATLDNMCDDRSNYHIEDVPITEDNIIPEIQQKLTAGNRVMVFVTSLASPMARKMAKEFKKYEPIKLSRATFDNAYKSLSDVSRKLILTTDMAEVGINVPELDVVVDPSNTFKYYNENNIIDGGVRPITWASRTQRRGRVGRDRPGVYMYVPRNAETYITADEFDADVLSAGRAWNDKLTITPFTLTAGQFLKWVDSDMTPFRVYLLYDQLGMARDLNNPDNLRIIMDLVDGFRASAHDSEASLHRGCGRRKCLCSGYYTFYDAREHDLLYGAGEDETLAK